MSTGFVSFPRTVLRLRCPCPTVNVSCQFLTDSVLKRLLSLINSALQSLLSVLNNCHLNTALVIWINWSGSIYLSQSVSTCVNLSVSTRVNRPYTISKRENNIAHTSILYINDRTCFTCINRTPDVFYIKNEGKRHFT